MYGKNTLSMVRAQVAATSDFGIPGTLRIGNPDALRVFTISALVYEGEVEALAAFAWLMRQPLALKDDVQICLLAARPDVREVTNNLNRLREDWATDNWERNRSKQISDTFGQMRVKALLDLQTNDDPLDQSGWAIVVSPGKNETPCSICIENLTDEQEQATGTAPFGMLFGCPAVEVLTWSGRKGQNASIETAVSWLANHGCFREARVERTIKQRVLEVTGYIKVPDATKAYTLDKIGVLEEVASGCIIGVADDDANVQIVTEDSGMLLLTSPSGKIRKESKDPAGYLATELRTVDQKIYTID